MATSLTRHLHLLPSKRGAGAGSMAAYGSLTLPARGGQPGSIMRTSSNAAHAPLPTLLSLRSHTGICLNISSFMPILCDNVCGDVHIASTWRDMVLATYFFFFFFFFFFFSCDSLVVSTFLLQLAGRHMEKRSPHFFSLSCYLPSPLIHTCPMRCWDMGERQTRQQACCSTLGCLRAPHWHTLAKNRAWRAAWRMPAAAIPPPGNASGAARWPVSDVPSGDGPLWCLVPSDAYADRAPSIPSYRARAHARMANSATPRSPYSICRIDSLPGAHACAVHQPGALLNALRELCRCSALRSSTTPAALVGVEQQPSASK